MRVAFQGEVGAYSHEAILRHYGPAAQPLPCRSFAAVFEQISAGQADRGLVPIENSLTGSIYPVYDLLAQQPLAIVGEVTLPIEHALLGLPGSTLAQIRRVYSHPQALGQCQRFLRELPLEALAHYDTAGAARWVAQVGDPANAAIAGRLAAERYGLEILASGIATSPRNTTRFFLLASRPEQRSGGPGPFKTSLLIETADRPGALYHALGCFVRQGVNLTKLESRPLGTQNWRYRFYLDLEGHADDPPVAQALEELRAEVLSLRLLGSYPRAADSGSGHQC
ncbi:MAG TPA: prephenate dehydratase [Candidatus Fraserbacteria bacterium]|nr:prephenate dehydratase [Candidatus Fraserbacteria bacterium]